MMHIESTDTEVDLCEPCAKEIMKFISNVKKESVEKRNWLGKKKSAQPIRDSKESFNCWRTIVAETEETGGESVSTETTGEAVGESVASMQTNGNGTEQSGESFFDYE